MAVIFPEPSVWREQSAWKTIFAEPSVSMSHSQLFSNFGSAIENESPYTDFESMLDQISLRLANDVIKQLESENIVETKRIAYTASGNRSAIFPTQPTPTNKKRKHQNPAANKQSTSILHGNGKKHARSRLGKLPNGKKPYFGSI